jgi:hypothetical protein
MAATPSLKGLSCRFSFEFYDNMNSEIQIKACATKSKRGKKKIQYQDLIRLLV